MAQSFQSSIKAKLQQMASPKVKPGWAVPSSVQQQRPTNGKTTQRDGSGQNQTTASPETDNRVSQRLLAKNFQFVPQNPSLGQQQPSKMPLQTCNITNCNNIVKESENQMQMSKISPTRGFHNLGNKMIIPANQIKLLKKDGTSPSPEGRKLVQQITQVSPPIIIAQHTARTSKQGKGQHSKAQATQQNSDDEATVISDSEETSNFNSMKTDALSNNFNRPKLNTASQQQSAIQNNALPTDATQRTSRNEPQKVKMISMNKIRQSPSPPPLQFFKQQQSPPSITNVQQTAVKPQLATDFIKGMINQSRTNNNILTTNSKKLSSGVQGAQQLPLKVKLIQNSPGMLNQNGKDSKQILSFKDAKCTNSGTQNSETSPIRPEEEKPSSTNAPQIINPAQIKMSHLRNYSPPPNFSHAGLTNIQKIVSTKEQNASQGSQKAEKTNTSQEQAKPTEDGENKEQQQQEGSVFQFPFQRRARSLSLTKQEQTNGNKQNATGAPAQTTNKSPSPGGEQAAKNEEGRRNKPVVAKLNFVIAQKKAMPKSREEQVFERNKEVEEWLMGSGESDATAGSSGSALQEKISNKQKTELEKPTQPACQALDDNCSGEEDEDWMFKTFDPFKGGKGKEPKGQVQTVRNRVTEVDPMDDFGESPFDMAPEMSKQFISKTGRNQDNFILEQIAQECADISQYMENIDAFMGSNYLD